MIPQRERKYSIKTDASSEVFFENPPTSQVRILEDQEGNQQRKLGRARKESVFLTQPQLRLSVSSSISGHPLAEKASISGHPLEREERERGMEKEKQAKKSVSSSVAMEKKSQGSRKGRLGSIVAPWRHRASRHSNLLVERHRVLLEPTYMMQPKERFACDVALDIMSQTMREHLAGEEYNRHRVVGHVKRLADEIKARINELGYDRYKLVCLVTIGQRWPRVEAIQTAPPSSTDRPCTFSQQILDPTSQQVPATGQLFQPGTQQPLQSCLQQPKRIRQLLARGQDGPRIGQDVSLPPSLRVRTEPPSKTQKTPDRLQRASALADTLGTSRSTGEGPGTGPGPGTGENSVLMVSKCLWGEMDRCISCNLVTNTLFANCTFFACYHE